MKPVQSTLKKWLKTNKNFQEHYSKLKQDVLNDSNIETFLMNHPELTSSDIERNLMKLYEYRSQCRNCQNCHSLHSCRNMIKGYSPVLEVVDRDIHLSYKKCQYLIEYEREREKTKLIQSLYMPKDILEASIEDIDNDSERGQAVLELHRFIRQVKDGIPEKGIYFHGPFGVGKTYFLGALANTLKNFNISSTLIYMPELVREMRASLKDDSVNKKIDIFKKADVLMLDDIGAELQSAWFRDEILGSILQFRMMEKRPVFFTSNYSLDQLETMLATTRSGVETVKAGRIIERIKQVSREVPVYGKNRRE
ncbi:primosomal protein DnaI [Cerasibacillus quisquiliarum]|uniref:Primosomal protein DnaI n=1 Tax=Cerasibacillus quisquiliarum TaxID=227865 RepID=A0A511V0M2_9BACI|nr:primosomal protein DnaI [Cerasibacillus quisquiliarum]MBB5145694.1 primosomal protein DnaI [Cerasibacillus quisquiliarum]GEN31488.1 primosomal protein DnaI [Cerasibacillus quisquiliarum]